MIDIIIVNYNSTDFLLKCIASIYKGLTKTSFNVFVEDNDSKDNPEQIKTQFPEVNVSFNPFNLGFSAAINQAIKRSSAPYILLLNPDTILNQDFFKPIIKYMEDHPDVGVAGPRILNPDGSVQGSARTFPTLLTGLFGRTTMFSRLFPNNRFTRGNIITVKSGGISPLPVDWVSGACMLVRRKAIDDVGLMDERFFLYWEDADWCRRMWGKGWKVVYFPTAFVVHLTGKSGDTRHIRSRFEFHKSSYLLFAKYTEWPLIKPLAAFILAFRFAALSILYLARQSLNLILKLKPADVQTRSLTKKIKVLRIISRLNIGGPAIHVQVLTEGLNQDKFDSTLITGSVSPHEGEMDYIFKSPKTKIIYLSELGREINLINDLKALIKIFRILLKIKPLIVETHLAKAGFVGRFAFFLYRTITFRPVLSIHMFHGNVFKGYFSKPVSKIIAVTERLMASITDYIIAISHSQKKELVEVFQIAPENKVKTIELGFNLTPFMKNAHLKGHFRQKLGLKDNSFLVGIVGRLAPIKNHRMFLDVAKALIKERPGLKIVFIAIGDGELRDELEAYCRNENISDRVIFYGWVQDIDSVYADLDALALTSINEGTPVSIIEAMASSVPVIATAAGGVVDLLGRSDNTSYSSGFKICDRGILCRINDSKGFASGLQWLIENHKTRAEKERVERAKMFVKERYTHRRLIRDMEKLYTDLAGTR